MATIIQSILAVIAVLCVSPVDAATLNSLAMLQKSRGNTQQEKAQVEDSKQGDQVSKTQCRSWCRLHVSLWARKCVWGGCAGCKTCGADDELRRKVDVQAKRKYLKFLRESQQEPSKERLNDYSQRQDDESDVLDYRLESVVKHDSPAPGALAATKSEQVELKCFNFCSGHVSLWKAKCTWSRCHGCGACDSSEENQQQLDLVNKMKYLTYLKGSQQHPSPDVLGDFAEELGEGQGMKHMPAPHALIDAEMQDEMAWKTAIVLENRALEASRVETAVPSNSETDSLVMFDHDLP